MTAVLLTVHITSFIYIYMERCAVAVEYIPIDSEFNIPCSFSGEGNFYLNCWEMNCTVYEVC